MQAGAEVELYEEPLLLVTCLRGSGQASGPSGRPRFRATYGRLKPMASHVKTIAADGIPVNVYPQSRDGFRVALSNISRATVMRAAEIGQRVDEDGNVELTGETGRSTLIHPGETVIFDDCRVCVRPD